MIRRSWDRFVQVLFMCRGHGKGSVNLNDLQRSMLLNNLFLGGDTGVLRRLDFRKPIENMYCMSQSNVIHNDGSCQSSSYGIDKVQVTLSLRALLGIEHSTGIAVVISFFRSIYLRDVVF
jgi:hypothetical protein